jgi:adenylate cyclase
MDVVFDQPEQTLDLEAVEAVARADPRRPIAELLPVLRTELAPDAHLAAAFKRSGRVVLGHYFEFGEPAPAELATTVADLPELSVVTLPGAGTTNAYPLVKDASRAILDVPVLRQAAAGSGHINFAPDPDGVYRRVPLAIRATDRLLPALVLEIVRVRSGASSATVTIGPEGVARVLVADHDVLADGAGQLWINYLGPPGTIPQVSAADVLAGRVPRDALANRIILIGFTAAGYDEVPTPFTPVAPGVELQATLVDNVLHDRALRRPWWLAPIEGVLMLSLGLLVACVLRWMPTGWGMGAVAVLLMVTAWWTQRLFTVNRLAVGGVYPLGAIVLCTLAGAVYQATAEGREKRKVRRAFAHYVNPAIADLIAEDPAHLRLGGERRQLTILFSDIRGFTGIAEGVEPELLGELLNEYLGAMTDLIFRHEGLLDKYIGDAIMAFWGAPVAVADHATRCCDTALDMLASLAVLQERWRAAALPVFDIRIGINSGDAIVGNFGSSRRFAYTAVGDDVNLASRLETMNSRYGTRILISERTRHAIGPDFICREIDRTAVRGKAHPVTIYELLGRRRDDATGALADRAARFDAALAAFRGQNRDGALADLDALAADYPTDRAIAALAERIADERNADPAG